MRRTCSPDGPQAACRELEPDCCRTAAARPWVLEAALLAAVIILPTKLSPFRPYTAAPSQYDIIYYLGDIALAPKTTAVP